MRKQIDSSRLRNAIDTALCAFLPQVQIDGIADIVLKEVKHSSELLRHTADQLEQNGHFEMTLLAEVELFLRISNADVLQSIEIARFKLTGAAQEHDFSVVAGSDENWALAWNRGMEPIKKVALETMCEDLSRLGVGPSENSYAFQSGMVLLASELVGPYVDRIAEFLGYPRHFVQVIGARLQEAKIWDIDDVRCEDWFDPNRGGTALKLDLMVAEGKLTRRWSEEKKQTAYQESTTKMITKFVV